MSLGAYAKAIVAFLTTALGWVVMNVQIVETDAGTFLQMPVTGDVAGAIIAASTVAGVVWRVPNGAQTEK